MKTSKKTAFTMIELIFVIVILGVLSAIAIPKFTSVQRSSMIAKAKADIATIRSAIVSERQTQLIKGVRDWIPKLSDSNTTLFTGDGDRKLLMYGIKSGTTSGKWSRGTTTATIDTYIFKIDSSSNKFDYNNTSGTFMCTSGNECTELTD